jgi:hypothetical protein
MSRRELDVHWDPIVSELRTRGWARIERAVEADLAVKLEAAAPGPWKPLPATEGGAGVRQAGLACHSEVSSTSGVVADLAEAIRVGIDGACKGGVPPLPAFNHADWCRAERGEKFITPHRDPSTAGGVIAVLTIRGEAPFRVWEIDGSPSDAERHPELATSWVTADRDLVLLRGGGWPTPQSRCPIHEAQTPLSGERMTLTLRTNMGGYGADYFT